MQGCSSCRLDDSVILLRDSGDSDSQSRYIILLQNVSLPCKLNLYSNVTTFRGVGSNNNNKKVRGGILTSQHRTPAVLMPSKRVRGREFLRFMVHSEPF